MTDTASLVESIEGITSRVSDDMSEQEVFAPAFCEER